MVSLYAQKGSEMTNIYVGNLSYRTNEAELRAMFSQYGEVARASIIKDREHNNRSKGFGFVEMNDAAAAQKAIAELNDKEVGGRKLRVNEAQPREARPPRQD